MHSDRYPKLVQRSTQILILLLVYLSLVSGCGSDKPTAPPQPTLTQRITGAEQRLAFKFFPVVNQQYPDSNIFYAPLDMMFESAGFLLGARGEGATEIKQGMEIDSLTVEQFAQGLMSLRQTIAASSPSVGFNQVLFECQGGGLYETYKAKCSTLLATEIVRFDCSSPSADTAIVDWWNENTHGYATYNMAELINPSWLVMQGSLFWFDGIWQEPFEPTTIREDSFLTSTGTRVACSLMTANGQLPTHQESGFSAVQLLYTDADLGSMFFLPDSGTSVATVVQSLTLSKWKSLQSQFAVQDVTIHLPKIHHQWSTLDVTASIQQIGINSFFTNIDLSDMANLPSAAYNNWTIKGYQRFFPDSMGNKSTKLAVPSSPNAVNFTFNRPFFYVVWHKPTGAILSLVKVTRPWEN